MRALALAEGAPPQSPDAGHQAGAEGAKGVNSEGESSGAASSASAVKICWIDGMMHGLAVKANEGS